MNTKTTNTLAVLAAALAAGTGLTAQACALHDSSRAGAAIQVPAAAVVNTDRQPRAGHWEWQGDGHVWVEDAPEKVSLNRARAGSPR
jgi:hypothetical protein